MQRFVLLLAFVVALMASFALQTQAAPACATDPNPARHMHAAPHEASAAHITAHITVAACKHGCPALAVLPAQDVSVACRAAPPRVAPHGKALASLSPTPSDRPPKHRV